MREKTILLIDSAESDPAEVIECVSPAVGASRLRLRTSSGIEDGLRILQELRAARRSVAAVIVGPHVGEPISLAREVNRLSPRTPVVLLATRERASEIERTLSALGEATGCWTTASVDAAAIADAIHDVVVSKNRTSRLRKALDDVDEMLISDRESKATAVGGVSARFGRGVAMHDDSPTDAIVSIDGDGHIATWNRTAERLFGLAEEEVVGRPLSDLAATSSREGWNALVGAIQKGEPVARRELRCRHKDGALLDADVTLARVHHPLDPRIATSAILRDVSTRRRIERLQAAQHDATRILADSATVGETAPRLVQSLCERLGWDVGCWWSVDAGGEVLRRDETWVVPAMADESLALFAENNTAAPGVDLAGRVWRSGEPLWIADVVRDADLSEEHASGTGDGLHAAFAFPIVSGSAIYGVVELLSRDVQSPDAELLELMAAIGGEVGQFIDRRHAEHALRASHALNQAVLDSLNARIALLDRQGRVIAVNDAWKRSARESNGEDGDIEIGANYLEVCRRALDASFDETRTALEGLRAVLTGTRPHFTMEYRCDEPGREHWFLVDATSLPTEIGGAVVSYLDIMDRKVVEEERARFLVASQEAIRLKNEFVATVSHELRTPLHAILGWIHLVRSGRLDKTTNVRGLDAIERNARQLSHLIDDVLDVSRITAATLRPRRRRVDLASTIEEAEESLRAAAEARNVEIVTKLDRAAGHVLGDRDRIRQIVWNLVSNAIKFTPSGGRVDVILRQADPNVEVVVSDTGQGIDAAFLPHVFDPFRQEDGTIRRRHGGLGVGLAIVRHLTELHGGAVRAESQGVGHGATFTITLPVMAPVGERTPAAPTLSKGESHSRPAPSLRGVRALLVEDEAETRELLTAMLQHAGADVRAVASTPEAVESLKRWRPDVLLSSLGRAGRDGYELIHTLRALPRRRGGATPAIALIARRSGDDRLHTLSAGFQNHVYKPVDFVELTTVVANVLGRIDMTEHG